MAGSWEEWAHVRLSSWASGAGAVSSDSLCVLLHPPSSDTVQNLNVGDRLLDNVQFPSYAGETLFILFSFLEYTVQMLHEILQLFYIINCILIRPNKQIAAICKSSFSAFKNSPLFLSDGV